MLNQFPLELIENILRQSTGSQFSRCSRVSTLWLKAKQNIDRTDEWFWQKKCREEIQWSLIEELNPYHKPLDLLTGDECKELYIRWFRTQRVDKLPKEVFHFNETFGSTFNGFENITSLTVTGLPSSERLPSILKSC